MRCAGQAAKLGLVDGCGTLQATMRERYGKNVRGPACLPGQILLAAQHLAQHNAALSSSETTSVVYYAIRGCWPTPVSICMSC